MNLDEILRPYHYFEDTDGSLLFRVVADRLGTAFCALEVLR